MASSAGIGEEVVKGFAKPPFLRQYSEKSEDALGKLHECENRLQSFENKFREYVYAATSDQDEETLVAMKNSLAIMVGEVDKLQMVDIDGVNTMDLNSGKDDARSSRKYLNKRTETLANRVAELHKAIKEHLEMNMQQKK